MLNTAITVKEVTTAEEAEKIILQYKDTYFLRAITEDDNRQAFINKHLENGHILVEYHDDKPVGFASFYSNDTENKMVYVTSLALDENLGFLKGKTLIRLIRKGMEIVKQNNMEIVRLEVERDNEKAIKLYKHFGFKVVSSEKDTTYYMEMKLADFKFA